MTANSAAAIYFPDFTPVDLRMTASENFTKFEHRTATISARIRAHSTNIT